MNRHTTLKRVDRAHLGRLFHRPGLIYLWALNADGNRQRLSVMIDRFAIDGVAGVILHPRHGLEVPYGGDDWFDLVEWIVSRCRQRGVAVWLYDEDPFPSGAAGGRLVAEHPEFAATEIAHHRYTIDAGSDDTPEGVFRFPAGRLLWCGVVDPSTGTTHDLTARVGMLRERWVTKPQWDSRYYYPDTPRYECPRAWTTGEVFGVRVPSLGPGEQLVAFTAQSMTPGVDGHWTRMPDTLNPLATRRFIELTHDRYRGRLASHFGQAIEAMFTDEPGIFALRPWTPGLFEVFEQDLGYDLRPRLWRLFDDSDDPLTRKTRVDYRLWCGRRFHDAWLQPVAQWCESNGLPLVGHMSPEDDPVQQVSRLGNLMPMLETLHIPGIDLIVPAAGDSNHPLLNIGVIAARSVAEQQNRQGVLSESLAASGEAPDARTARRVLTWQTMMGVTTAVVHAAFESMHGHRAIDAPPDFGPGGPAWDAMADLGVELKAVQSIVAESRQVAPVAILWPIRSFAAEPFHGYLDHDERRRRLARLVGLCLDLQIGIHLLDEPRLWSARWRDNRCHVGPCAYEYLLAPASTLWHKKTIIQLTEAQRRGVGVMGFDEAPGMIDTDEGLQPFEPNWPTEAATRESLADLPRLLSVAGDAADLRVTAWRREQKIIRLAMNLRQDPIEFDWIDKPIQIAPDELWQLGPDGECRLMMPATRTLRHRAPYVTVDGTTGARAMRLPKATSGRS